MDFTREPIVQTVITPKEGCKIVVRSSKNSGQEEYFVDAVEVISFGNAIFFRSLERPKSFLVPASDYEVLEVREARMVLKNVGVDRAIKIGGGREAPVKHVREREPQHHQQPQEKAEDTSEGGSQESQEISPKNETKAEARLDKKRDRRRNSRRRRGREEGAIKDSEEEGDASESAGNAEMVSPSSTTEEVLTPLPASSVLTSLLPPPLTLISETISRYRDNASFKSAFFSKEENEQSHVSDEELASAVAAAVEYSSPGEEGEKILPPTVPLEQPEFGSYEMSEEEQEAVYLQRNALRAARQSDELPATSEEQPAAASEGEESTELDVASQGVASEGATFEEECSPSEEKIEVAEEDAAAHAKKIADGEGLPD